ncbi:MAG: isopentenyl-diphosphate delta-isomerase [Bacteroidetes bacterium GWE2_41_25]|nr:MAG: isopentenyl-diphosphate delta-isomerase [Bacteroidetes bacterium GWA2_40_15]OFX92829.1 MAG: isopentenyl-diphosphate delta-isomerase [Bacteroidetes bacterium GWE2_41_25]OFY56983.1 MAG: isopentenyl-diphosphate delta-isomerase [Bacteroidetes bacterium GWF2_41_9]HAM11710.1 isopentenyl-diphosphate delta-isomerase [Bacteroidales bacterium]HBH84694.1 isopentenyl-diphosphate delta-isomerase [Bacteroidales bacterium]
MNREEIKVILVDENDIQTGMAGKLEAHEQGLLHRAVSVFIVNSRGDWILQRRALDKYHSNGLWTNTCCTHPQKGESVFDAAKRRLMEEMGIRCNVTWLFSFIYKEKFDNDLTEHELDHVFLGITEEEPVINTTEVEEWKKIPYSDLHNDIVQNPDKYTYWFRAIYEKVNNHIGKI